jgi:hypothetical protein
VVRVAAESLGSEAARWGRPAGKLNVFRKVNSNTRRADGLVPWAARQLGVHAVDQDILTVSHNEVCLSIGPPVEPRSMRFLEIR